MRVFVAGTRGFPGVQGGVETHCEHLYPRLADLGCDVTVCRRRPYVEPVEGNVFRGVRFVDLWCPRQTHLEAITHTTGAVLEAARRGADLLHLHCAGPALCTPLACGLGLPVVFTSQGPDYARQKWGPVAKSVLRLGEKWGARGANRTIVVSRHIQRMFCRKYSVEAELIPNGVELPPPVTSDEHLAEWGLQKGRYVFALGRLVPEKGFHDLLAAYEGLDTEWKLALAGEADHPSPYSRELRKRAEAVPGAVMTGFVKGERLRQLYAHCGLWVLPSYHEGLPLVLLEALSYGCSVLVSDIPANRSVDLPEGRFFPVGDPAALRRKMAHWLRRGIDEEERRRNLQMIRDHYDWDDIARRTLRVYEKAVEEPG